MCVMRDISERKQMEKAILEEKAYMDKLFESAQEGIVMTENNGKVIKVNKKLEMSPELVNQDPYGNGWVAQIQPTNFKKELGKLLIPQHYAEYLKKILHK